MVSISKRHCSIKSIHQIPLIKIPKIIQIVDSAGNFSSPFSLNKMTMIKIALRSQTHTPLFLKKVAINGKWKSSCALRFNTNRARVWWCVLLQYCPLRIRTWCALRIKAKRLFRRRKLASTRKYISIFIYPFRVPGYVAANLQRDTSQDNARVRASSSPRTKREKRDYALKSFLRDDIVFQKLSCHTFEAKNPCGINHVYSDAKNQRRVEMRPCLSGEWKDGWL